MTLFELFVKIGLDDQASEKLADLSSKLGSGLATAAKIGTAAVGAAAAGITALTTAAVNNYAEYEQLVGGVETLFKENAEYIRESAVQAFKTAGLSANEYMSTVTSFSASLLQSLGGDTEAAVEYADQAIIDMSDNANKMGTSMESIQNAYQGFAKQNYTMLDNLKLGYGGTKEEMARLIADANAVKEANGEMADLSISSFADITEAIHIIQTEMGITGTTVKEAGTTISGSVGSMKAAWTNLLTQLANGNVDIKYYVDDLVTTIVGDGTENNLGVIGNILPAIETALGGIAKLIEDVVPKIIEIFPGLVDKIVPSLISAATGMVDAVIKVVPDLLDTVVDALIQNAPALITAAIGLVQSLIQGIQDNYQILVDGAVQIITQLATGIIGMLPQIVQLGLDLIVSLANGIAESLPELTPTIIDVMMQIVDTLTEPETLSNLLDAALVLLTELAYGLMEAIPALVDATLTIIEKLVEFLLEPENITKLLRAALEIVLAIGTGLVNSIPRIIESVIKLVDDIIDTIIDTDWAKVGKDIVNGLLNGLKNMWGSLKKWFTNSWDNLVGGVKDLLGIHSPSRVFAGIGKNMALGVGEGWEDEFNDIQDDIDKSLSFDDASIDITSSIRKVGTGESGMAYGGTSIGNITINIDGAKYSNENSLAEAIAEALQNMTDRRAAVYA